MVYNNGHGRLQLPITEEQMLIDTHTHLYPPGYLQILRHRDALPRIISRDGDERLVMFADPENSPMLNGPRLTPEFYSIDAKLAYMDCHQVDGAFVSLGNPWLDFMPPGEGAAHAAAINNELVNACRQEHSRLWALACLPTSSVEASVAELRRIAVERDFVGVFMGTRLGGGWIDEEAAAPFWACVEETGLPVFIHPHYAVGGDEQAAYDAMLRFSLGFPFETTVAAARLIMSGILDRYPNLKIVLAHAGGALPALIGRIGAYCGKGYRTKLQLPIPQYLDRFYFDAITYSPEALRMVVNLVGCSRLLFGTDHPFAAADPQQLCGILSQAGLTEHEQAQVMYRNATRLFNL